MARAFPGEETGRSSGRAATGAPRAISDAQVEAVITQTLESMPVNSTHWSTRPMAQKTGLSQTAIVAFGNLSWPSCGN